MANETRGARKSEPTFSAPKIDNTAKGAVMSWDNLNGQTFPMSGNTMRNAFGDEAKPRVISANQSFENTTPNLVRSATKNSK